MPLDVRWMSLFADVPAAGIESAGAFWSAVTTWPVGGPAGEHGEYLPLVPAGADAYVWLQRVGRRAGGWHLDLHVPDVSGAAQVATRHGARIERNADDLVTLASPGGQPFCLVRETAASRRLVGTSGTAPAQRCLLDQICIDIPAGRYDAELVFWTALTGWRVRPRQVESEFDALLVPAALPLRVLLQRLGADHPGGIGAHADFGTGGARDAHTARHVGLGAAVVRVTDDWTTLRDPAGLLYCITDHAPKN